MATMQPMTSEAIALTEKKMDMTLDDIIKMSKKSSSKTKKPRASNKSRQFPNNGASKASKVQRYMDSRSSVRQGVLAQRRSNFRGNQFPLTTEAAKKAAVIHLRNGPHGRSSMPNWNKQRVAAPRKASVNGYIERVKMVPRQRSQTLDSLFANMKEQRMRCQMGHGMQAQARPQHRFQGSQRQWRGRVKGKAAGSNITA